MLCTLRYWTVTSRSGSVRCAGCDRVLDEPLNLDPGQRDPCPDCGSLGRKREVILEASRTSDAKLNKAIERYAVETTIGYFKENGWSVTELGKPYDLKCIKGKDELRIEVKGSSGPAKTVSLTINEVNHAKNFFPNVALAVVANIKYVRTSSGKIACSGGSWFLAHPWQITDTALKPLVFDYEVS